MSTAEVLLRVERLCTWFPVTSGLLGAVVGQVRAVDDVSFALRRGETLALVGESGCGKTTLGRTVLRLEEPTAGRIEFEGRDITRLGPAALQPVRRAMQIVFQDPQSSLNPRMTVGDLVGESLRVHGLAKGAANRARVEATLARVGLPAGAMHRYPHEFSGGQRQRIGIARALALEPKLIVCDEAVSALDVSIQAQVLNLLIELRETMQLAYLFIAHDLAVVRHIADRVAVMYLGQLVEVAPTEALFRDPAHPYSRALLSAIPVRDPRQRAQRIVLQGDAPNPRHPPQGCRFHTRCPAVMARCRTEVPPAYDLGAGRLARCFLAEGLAAGEGWQATLAARSAAAAAASRAPPPQPGAAALVPSSLGPASSAAPSMPPPAAIRRPPPARRVNARALAAGVLALLVLGSAALLVLERQGRPARAEAQQRALEAELARATALRGAPPASLQDLGWRLYAIFPDGRPLDPWGRPWQYQATGDGFALRPASDPASPAD
jgi:oligopeptide/dipeptide ABC transporter ATP-binding protein